MSNKQFHIEEHLLNYTDISGIDLPNLLEKKQFLIIKGFYPMEPLRKKLDEINNTFSSTGDQYFTGELTHKNKNFQRFDIGNFPSKNPKCMRVKSFFPWNTTFPFEDIIEKMKNFRNENGGR